MDLEVVGGRGHGALGQDASVKTPGELDPQHLDNPLHLLDRGGGQIGLPVVDETQNGLENLHNTIDDQLSTGRTLVLFTLGSQSMEMLIMFLTWLQL